MRLIWIADISITTYSPIFSYPRGQLWIPIVVTRWVPTFKKYNLLAMELNQQPLARAIDIPPC